MRRIFVPFRLNTKRVQLKGEIAHRLLKVLRLKIGDRVVLFDPKGSEWVAEVEASEPEIVWMQLIEPSFSEREHPVSLWLYQGIPKGEKMDFIVQKATELGVHRIIPMWTRRTVVQLSAERARTKCERWQRLAKAAAEQCGARFVPEVAMPKTFAQALQEVKNSDVLLLFYEAAEEPLRKTMANYQSPKIISLMVGPEGGFEPEEISAAQKVGAHIVSLGKRILRTETASIVAIALVLYELGLLD